MKCLACGTEKTRVLETRALLDGSVTKRRIRCGNCHEIFSTLEIDEKSAFVKALADIVSTKSSTRNAKTSSADGVCDKNTKKPAKKMRVKISPPAIEEGGPRTVWVGGSPFADAV